MRCVGTSQDVVLARLREKLGTYAAELASVDTDRNGEWQVGWAQRCDTVPHQRTWFEQPCVSDWKRPRGRQTNYGTGVPCWTKLATAWRSA